MPFTISPLQENTNIQEMSKNHAAFSPNADSGIQSPSTPTNDDHNYQNLTISSLPPPHIFCSINYRQQQIVKTAHLNQNTLKTNWMNFSLSAPPYLKNLLTSYPTQNLRAHKLKKIHNFSFSFNGGGTTS